MIGLRARLELSALQQLDVYVGRDPTVLALPPLLVGAVYTFEVRVAFTRDLAVYNSARVVVTVQPAGLVASIAGGDRGVGTGVGWQLDASGSVDLDGTADPLR